MTTRRQFTMTQADYDAITDRITAARRPSGRFLSGGMPTGDARQTANDAWIEVGNRLGFDGMTARPVDHFNPLEFTAIPKEIKRD